jgi:O-antigen/teichoic acid export membrane protein
MNAADATLDSTANAAIARVARNSVWLVAGQIVSKIFTFAYVLVLARYLGVEAFGNFNLVLSFVMVADIATDFGLTRLIIRDLARDLGRLPHYLGVLLPLKAMLIAAGYVVMISTVTLMGYRSEVTALAVLAGLGMFPLGLGTLLDAGCHARQRMQWSSLAQIALAITQAVVGGVVLLAGGGVWAAVGVALLANCAFFGVQLWASYRLGFRMRWLFSFGAALPLLRQSLPYAGVALLGALAMRAELLVLGWFGSAAELGIYSAAIRFYEAAAVVPVMIASASTPAMSQFHAESAERLAQLYRWTISRVLMLTVPVAIGVALLADYIVALLFAPQYAPAASLLRQVFIAYPLAAIYIVNGSLLLASNHATRTVGMSLGIVTLQLLMAFWMIPHYGARGAANSLLIVQAVAAAVSTWCVLRWYGLGVRAAKSTTGQP